MKPTTLATNNFIDVAILTSLPANCVNRDDNGRPKTVVFGGVERQSPSSQFLKRGWRLVSTKGTALVRTQNAAGHICDKLGLGGEAANLIASILFKKGKADKADKADDKTEDKAEADTKGKTKAIILFTKGELEGFEAVVSNHLPELNSKKIPKDLPETLHKEFLDVRGDLTERLLIGLYGRMVTNSPIEAAPDGGLMICRAISTSKASLGSDYFTAIDDLQPTGEVGAGMMGNKAFMGGSNVLIQYRICLDLVMENAGVKNPSEALYEVVQDLISTTLETPIPGAANQGTMSTSPRTHTAIIRFSKGMACDLAPAFQVASRPTDSIAQDSQRLLDYAQKASDVFGAPKNQLVFQFDEGKPLAAFIDSVKAALHA